MKIRFAKPLIDQSDIDAVAQSLKQRTLTNGGNVMQFEERFVEYIGGGIAVAVSSCTAALYMAMKCLDIGAGDEVIVPALSFAACAHVVEAVGAVPVFVDVRPETGVIDPALAEAAIGPKTKAIMAMHYVGKPCDLSILKDICRRRNIFLVEDCATALGALHSNIHVGLHGDIGCFSFHAVKHVTCGEGGMLVTRHPEIAERARKLRQFGIEHNVYDQLPGEYDVIQFGLNFRMTEMQAALGLGQLAKANTRLSVRERNWRAVQSAIDFATVLDTAGAFYALIVMLPDGLDQHTVRIELSKQYIETSIYYPGPLPHTSYYRRLFVDFPAAEKIAKQSIALSCGPHLTLDHMAYQVDTLRDILCA